MPAEATYPFEQANKYHQGRAGQTSVIVVHCTDGLESGSGDTAKNVQDMFAHNTRDASTHLVANQIHTLRSVHDWDTAWAVVYFNAIGLHLELVGLSNQTKDQWLDPISKATLLNGAKAVADWSLRYNVPVNRFLTVPELQADAPHGLTTHVDCDHAKPSTGHTDPGINFPRDIFLGMVSDALRKTAPAPIKHDNPFLAWALPCGPGWGVPPLAPSNRVKFFQWAAGIPVDGIYGPQSEAICNAIKRRLGLQQNGVVDWALIARLKGIRR